MMYVQAMVSLSILKTSMTQWKLKQAITYSGLISPCFITSLWEAGTN